MPDILIKNSLFSDFFLKSKNKNRHILLTGGSTNHIVLFSTESSADVLVEERSREIVDFLVKRER